MYNSQYLDDQEWRAVNEADMRQRIARLEAEDAAALATEFNEDAAALESMRRAEYDRLTDAVRQLEDDAKEERERTIDAYIDRLETRAYFEGAADEGDGDD